MRFCTQILRGPWLFCRAIVLGGILPWLVLAVLELLFDSRGGEPFAGVLVILLFTPVWIVLGIVAAAVYVRVPPMRTCIHVADLVLIATAVLLTVWLRWSNARARDTSPLHPDIALSRLPDDVDRTVSTG